MDKFLLVLCTAFPGLQKLILLITIAAVYNSDIVGLYSVDIGVATFFSFITSVGYAAILLKKIPSSDHDLKIATLSSNIINCLILSTSLIPFIFVMSKIGWVHDFLGVSVALISIGLNQIFRHFYLAERNYLHLLILDLLAFILQIVAITLSTKNSFLILSSLTTISVLFICSKFLRLKILFLKETVFENDAIQFALNNIVSAGIAALIPMILLKYYTASFTGVVSTYISGLSFFMILIRSFSNYLIPALIIKIKENGMLCDSMVNQYRIRFYQIFFLAFIFALLSYFLIDNVLPALNMSGEYIIDLSLYISIVLFIFSASASVFSGNILFVLSKQKYNLYSNILYTLIFVSINFIFLWTGVSIDPALLITTFALISFIRFPYLSFYVSKFVR